MQEEDYMMSGKKAQFLNFVLGDDMDFYEEFVVNLSDEDQLKFLEENPKFMSNYCVDKNNILMLRDKSYRGILRKIKGVRRNRIWGCQQMVQL